MLTAITGYDDYQIYLLLSCAPVQGHIAGIVDIPNACTTLVSGFSACVLHSVKWITVEKT